MDIRRKLSDLISLQDDITHLNESKVKATLLNEMIRVKQGRRDALIREIAEAFDVLQGKQECPYCHGKGYVATEDGGAFCECTLDEQKATWCLQCGSDLQLVRPGKWQCTKCELDRMLTEARREGYEVGRSRYVNPDLIDRELIAAAIHDQWSGWMEYLFSQCWSTHSGAYGNKVIPASSVEHWKRQMTTPYADLTEEEKDSDREEADKIIAVILQHNNKEVTMCLHDDCEAALYRDDSIMICRCRDCDLLRIRTEKWHDVDEVLMAIEEVQQSHNKNKEVTK